MAERREFPATPWSLVREAALTGSPDYRFALSRLCEAYWYPLYAFARKNGHSEDSAGDLVQGFFAAFLSKNYLKNVDEEQGKFRSYLLQAWSHHVSNERTRAAAKKRGGGVVFLTLDLEDGERRWSREPHSRLTPERLYERKWALALLEHVLTTLRTRHERSVKADVFECLYTFLPGSQEEMSYEEAARRTGMTIAAVKVAVHRLRRSYRDHLRREVLRTVDTPEQVDAEIRHLFNALENPD